MSNFTRLLGVAKKALDAKNGSSAGGSGQTDWRQMVRSAADAITGDGRAEGAPAPARPAAAPAAGVTPAAPVSPEDRAAIARYDYLLQTADPAAIEQVHRDAFERLTPAQRDQIEQRMRAELPAHEHPSSATAADLARTATRAEVSRPGMLRGLLARVGGGGVGGGGAGRSALIGGAAAGVGVAAGGMLAAVAGGAILSSVAGPLLEQAANIGVDFDALAGSLDLGVLAEGVDVEGLTGGLGESVSGLGEQVSGIDEQLGGWELPGLGDFLGR